LFSFYRRVAEYAEYFFLVTVYSSGRGDKLSLPTHSTTVRVLGGFQGLSCNRIKQQLKPSSSRIATGLCRNCRLLDRRKKLIKPPISFRSSSRIVESIKKGFAAREVVKPSSFSSRHFISAIVL
jgi:hypothetical protein